MSVKDSWPHLVAGGVAGMMGAVITSPLEVVKTRFQSSVGTNIITSLGDVRVQHQTSLARYSRIWTCLSHIVMQEGVQGLFRGLAPTLMGEASTHNILSNFLSTKLAIETLLCDRSSSAQ